MYTDHVCTLSRHGKASPSGLADLCTFALASIRQRFELVPKIARDIRAKGEQSEHLWGWKAAGYRAAHGDAGRDLFGKLQGCAYAEDAIGAIMAAIPGLAIVKAGFVASMLGYDVGCIDSRNAARLGVAPRAFRVDIAAKRLPGKIADYVALCRQLGGAETLWDDWCNEYAESLGLFYKPQDVSGWHLAAISNAPRRAKRARELV